jgi:hypothetical protein
MKNIDNFIQGIFLRNAFNAAISRGRVYAPRALPVEKKAFRSDCKRRLSTLGNRYFAWELDLDDYCQEIVNFCDAVSRDHTAALANGRLRVGTAQKMISLYLKYLWLSGDSSKKPICAVLDRPILVASGYLDPPNWTEFDDIKLYERIQKCIGLKAFSEGFGSPAVWEAENWRGNEEEEED